MRSSPALFLYSLSSLLQRQKTDCAGASNSSYTGEDQNPHWPRAWTTGGCTKCICNYDSKTVNCSYRNLHNGLPPASTFPFQEVAAFFFTNSSVSIVDSDYFLKFQRLQIIRGDNNQLRSPFPLPPNIVSLSLSRNCISSVSGFFRRKSYGYKFLTDVNMNNNCLEKLVSGDFSGFPRLRLLRLAWMKGCLVLEKGAISNLPLLSELRLDFSKVTGKSVKTLDNLGSKGLQLNIVLSGNDIGELGEDFLLVPTTTELHLFLCKIRHLHPNAFRYLHNLQYLDLSDNNIDYLPPGLLRNVHANIFSLFLSGNQLESVSGSVFRKGQQMFDFFMDNNLLVEIDETLLGTITVVLRLDISSNSLTRLPASLQYHRFLSSLVLIDNNLTTIESSSFNGLSNLQHLYLMRNRISSIEAGAFESLTSANRIYLMNNNLTSLPSDLLSPLPKCTIWLDCGRLKTIPRVSKDLNMYRQCVTEGHGVDVVYIEPRLSRTLARSGFVCKKAASVIYNCSECSSGTMSTLPIGPLQDPTTSRCQNCPAGGWYQDVAGQGNCKQCVNGTYVRPDQIPGRSPLDCAVCPTGTNTTTHAGFRACPCLQGFYRLDRFGPCMACNATSPGLTCEDEYPSVKAGYWWSWTNSNNSHAQQLFVNFITQLTINNNSYHRSSVNFIGHLPIVFRCLLPNSCHGGVTDEEMCEEGHAGPLCSLCDNEYFSWFNTCQQCPPLWRGVLQLLLVLLLTVFLMFVLFKADRLRMTGRQHAATVVDQIASKAKILVGFAQVMAAVLSALAYVPWPPLLLRAGSWLKSVELNIVDLANPSCFSSRLRVNELEKTVVNIIGQVLLLASIFFYYRLRYGLAPLCWSRFRPDNISLSLARRSCLRNSWWILFLCYPSTTAHIMATLPYKEWTCMKLCHYNNQQYCPWYLKADLSIQCRYDHDGDNRVLFIICWSMTSYVVCLPLLLLWGLFRRHRSPALAQHRCSYETDSVSLFNRGNSERADLLKSLEFLDENYKTKFWYWELLEMARKFLLTCGIQYFGSSSLSGVAIAALIGNVFLLLHAQFKPIKRKSEHWLQLLSLLVISLSLMLGTLITLEQATYDSSTSEKAYDRQVFSVIVLVVNGLFSLYLLGRVAFAAYTSVKKVMSSEGSGNIVLFFIYFFSDDNSNDPDSGGNGVTNVCEGELVSPVVDGTS